MSEIVLINVSGRDRPGVTADLMDILARYGVRVLDIGQAMIHEGLALGMLVEIPTGVHSKPVLADIGRHAEQFDLHTCFTCVPQARYEQWTRGRGQPRYVVTLLGRSVTAAQIAHIARIITDHNLTIEDIVQLSGRSTLHHDDPGSRACIELAVRGRTHRLDEMKSAFVDASDALGIDISFQEDDFHRRNRRLVVFDMDSTLIRQEVIVELAREAGSGAEVARVTEAAMRGEIDFRESLRKRVALLKGLPESVLERVAGRLTLTEGAERLIRILRILGYRTAVISGGFTYFGRHLQRQLHLDHVHANELEIADGRLTGRVAGEIVDGEHKARLLGEIADREAITLQQVVAVGDGANDLPMLQRAGLGIAFHAKPVVRRGARMAISTVGLDGILYLMGMKDTETPY